VVPAYAASAAALIVVLSAMAAQTEVLAGQVEQGFGQHPDAEIYRSQPGLGSAASVMLVVMYLARLSIRRSLSGRRGAGLGCRLDR
jgi:hypothetical protein